MAVRSDVLVYPHTVPATSVAALTVPSGRTAVIRSIWMHNRHATTAVAVRIGIGSTSSGVRFHQTPPLAALESLILDSWLCLSEGDTLWFSLAPNTANAMQVAVFGSLLDGVNV